jgi:hypothetical protein
MFRGFDKNINNHISHLISKYDCDVYLNFWDIQGWGGVSMRLDTDSNIVYNEDENNIIVAERVKGITNDEINYVKDKLSPISLRVDSFSDFELKTNNILENIRSHQGPPFIKNILSMYHSINRCSELINDKINYDVVLKLRSDLFFLGDITLTKPEKNTIYYNGLGSWEGAINDTLIYGDPETMEVYHGLYHELNNLWGQLNTYSAPETLLGVHLFNNKIISIKEIFNYKLKRRCGKLD